MGSGDAEYIRMKRKPFYARLIVVSSEDITQRRSMVANYPKRCVEILQIV